jgi:transcription elongation factor Elf1
MNCPSCNSENLWSDEYQGKIFLHCYDCTCVWESTLTGDWAKIDTLFHNVLEDPGEERNRNLIEGESTR